MPSDLSCASCGTRYVLRTTTEGQPYVCLRCDVWLTGPRLGERSGSRTNSRSSGVRYVYGSASTATRRAEDGAGEIAAPATWSERSEAESHPPPEERPIGRYALTGLLGRGGMGVVYRAFDPDLGRPVALKLVIGGAFAGGVQVERFLREARTAARMDHPNLVRVYDIGRHDGQVYFTMDLVEGPSLGDVLAEIGRLPVREALRILAATARGVHAAHLANVLHRDLKPANILLEVDGTPRVTDFGLAREADAAAKGLTRSGQILGTPAYMPPEQALGEMVDVRSDVYALGAVLYEMLCGRTPYPSTGAITDLIRLLEQPPEPLARTVSDLPPEVVAICERAMARDRTRRYPTAEALARDCEAWLAGEPTAARPETRAERLLRAAWRQRLVLVASGLVLAFVVTPTLVWRRWSQATEAAAHDAREATAAHRLDALRVSIDAPPAQAEAAFEAFLSAPEHAGTRAVSEAWRVEAARRRLHGLDDGELLAYAGAYETALDVGQRIDALAAMSAAWETRWAWDALVTTGQTLERERGDSTEPLSPQGVRALVLGRVAAHDFAGAADRADAGGDPWNVVLRHLASTTALLSKRSPAAAMDLDGVEGDELVYVERGSPDLLVVLGPGGVERERVPLPIEPDLQPIGLSGGHLLFVSGTGTMRRGLWMDRGPDGLSVVARFPVSLVTGWADADLDLDGRREAYLSTWWPQRGLWRLEPEARGDLDLVRAFPTLPGATSDGRALWAGDVDGDDADELVIGSGPWRAFDLRILDPSPSGPVTLGRDRLGDIDGPVAIRTADGLAFAVVRAPAWPAPDALGWDRPGGEPLGVYVYRIVGGALRRISYTPLPAWPGGRIREGAPHLLAGDLDGDGLDDLIDGHEGSEGSLLLRQRTDGTFDALPLPGIRVDAMLQLDDDAPVELVSSPRTGSRILGLGTEPMPIARQAAAPRAVPAVSDAVVRRTFSRAEDLVAMGQHAGAARSLGDVALLSTDDAPIVRRRAAELFEVAGDWNAAADAWLAVPDDRAAVAALALAGRPEDAVALLGTDEHADLRKAITDLTQRVEPPLAQDLDERWSVWGPASVRTARTGLRIETFDHPAPVLTRPVVRVGEAWSFEAVLRQEWVPWGGGISVAVVPRGGGPPLVELDWAGAGGGGGAGARYSLSAEGHAFWRRAPWASAEGGRVVRFVARSFPSADRLVTEVYVDGVLLQRESVQGTATATPDRAFDLVVRGAKSEPGCGAVVILERLALGGFAEGPAETDALLASGRRLALGQPGLAAEAAAGADESPRRALALAVAYWETGDRDSAVAALRRADPDDPELAIWLRQAGVASLVGSAWGERVIPIYANAIAVMARQHPRELWTASRLARDVPSSLERRPSSTALLDDWRQLRLLRGQALRELGRVGEARAVLVSMLDEPDAWAAPAAMELTILEASSNDLDNARRYFREAVARSTVGEIMRDNLLIRPEVALLCGDGSCD